MGLGSLASWAITSVFSSLATGTHVIVARRYGERAYAGAGDVLNNSLLLSLLLGIAFAIPGYFFSYNVISFFSSDPAVAMAGTGYMQWRFLGLLFFLFVVSYRGFFNGIGHTKVFMYSAIIINLTNILFNYIFIFGALGVPAMGLTGAGVSFAVSNVLGCLFFLSVTFLPRYRRRYRYYTRFRVLKDVLRQVIKISAPVSFQNILILLGFLVFVAITGMIGTSQQAASQVVITALFMSFLPCFGFGVGAQTLVGQSLGTGDKGLAKRYGMETARLATYFTTVLGIIFVAFPDLVITILTNDAGVADVARPILRIAGAAQIFYAMGIVLANALQAAGATVFVMRIEVLTHWVVFLPLSYILGVRMGWGIQGAWLALPVYIVAYSLLIYRKYQSGSWLSMTV
jgi:putative MATE family efflux protein